MAIPRFRPSLSVREALSFWRAGVRSCDCTIDEFELGFADKLVPGQQVTLAPSGRVALYWLLAALELQPGDEVVTQAFNFPAVPAAVLAAGARPVFLDLLPDTFEPDPEHLKKIITPRTRAVVLTHLYGNPADLDALLPICQEAGVAVIEDCAQAVGAAYRGRPVGTNGRGCLFTFGPTKNFSLLAGGAAATGDLELAARIADLALLHPRVSAGRSLYLGAHATGLTLATSPLAFTLGLFPALQAAERLGLDPVHKIMGEAPAPLSRPEQAPRPSAWMAGVGLAQLERYEALNRGRVRNGWYLRKRLADQQGFTLCPMREGSVFVSFPIYHPRPEALARELQQRGVDVDLGFMRDCSSLELFADSASDCPQTRRAAAETVHLPIYPHLKKAQLDRVADALLEAVAKS